MSDLKHDDPDLTVERRGSTALVTFRSDSRLNAMRNSFWPTLRQTLEEAEADDEVRVIVLTGEGTRAFSAGGDIHGYLELKDAADRRAFIVDCLRTFARVEATTKPVIAAVNGVALGGGFELILACDVVIAAESASFGVPEASLGLAPGFGIVRLLDHLSPGWARYLVFTGEAISAAMAERLGLVQFVVPPDQLLERALAIAERMAQSAPLALTTAKSVINSSLNARYYGTVDSIVMLQGTEDAAEGIAAFQGRRSPTFSGR